MSQRPPVPEGLRRKVLVEAHHRCAICREPSYDVAHIEPWSRVKEHTFENLIALCPNCHRRHHEGQIDMASLRMYKANLSIISERYGDYERRVLEMFAENPQAIRISLTQADIHVLYLVKDGLLNDLGPVRGATIRAGDVLLSPKAYELTEKGREFVDRWLGGQDLSHP
jgi:HNH endonuclease